MHADSDFSEDELAQLRTLEGENPQEDTRTQEGEAIEPEQQAAAQAVSEQSDADAGTKTETAAEDATGAAKAADVEPPKADRQALRAARRSERRALEAVARLEGEVEALKAKGGEPAQASDDLDDPDLEADFPAVAKALKQSRAQLQAVQAELGELRRQPSAAQEVEFVPPHLPDNVQDAVDEIPELLAWQTTEAGQDKWALAVQADNLLRVSPKWKDKPMVERLAEAARRVRLELDEPTASIPSQATNTRRDPAAVIASAERTAPVTLSDLRGGQATEHTQRLSRADMQGMDDDALLNALG